jgi:hypothetical protein
VFIKRLGSAKEASQCIAAHAASAATPSVIVVFVVVVLFAFLSSA